MESEEEKKVETQTTEKAENSNVGQNTEKDLKDNKEEQEVKGTEENVAKAFGNTAEKNKNEGEKVKKDKAVAKTNADGSITFKSQEELDGFINRMYSKGAKSAEQKASETREEQLNEKEHQSAEIQEENEQIDTEGIRAKIALSMIDLDVNAKKAKRAAMLVDLSKVCENGEINDVKLKEEIDSIISEWPELKAENTQELKKGFAFGGSQENSNINSDDLEISRIFGNSAN